MSLFFLLGSRQLQQVCDASGQQDAGVRLRGRPASKLGNGRLACSAETLKGAANEVGDSLGRAAHPREELNPGGYPLLSSAPP